MKAMFAEKRPMRTTHAGCPALARLSRCAALLACILGAGADSGDRRWIDRDASKPWWQYPCDYYYCKNDWKAQAIAVPSPFSSAIQTESPVRTAWIRFFSTGTSRLSVNGQEAGKSFGTGFFENYDLTPFVSGAKEILLEVENAGTLLVEGEAVCEDGASVPIVSGPDWGRNLKVVPLNTIANARHYTTPPMAGVLWARDEKSRAHRDIAKGLARIQKFDQKIEYDLRASRAPEELVMIETGGLYDMVLARGRAFSDQARKMFDEAVIQAGEGNDVSRACESAAQAGALLSQAEAPAEALLTLRGCDAAAGHIGTMIKLLESEPDFSGPILEWRQSLAALETSTRDLSEALDRQLAKDLNFTVNVPVRKNEIASDIAALRRGIGDMAGAGDADTGHEPLWMEMYLDELGGYLDRAEWELELDSISGALRMARTCARGLHEIREKIAARGGKAPRAGYDALGNKGGTIGGRADAIAEELRRLGESVSAGAGAPAGGPDEFTLDRFGWIASMRLLGDEACHWGNDPKHLEFNYTPESVPVIDLAGKGWRFGIDMKNEGMDNGWFEANFDDKDWPRIYAPDWWERQGQTELNPHLVDSTPKFSKLEGNARAQYPRREDKPYNGFGWYRIKVEIPADCRGRDIVFRAGALCNEVELFVNGRPVYEKPDPGHWGVKDRIIPAAFWRWGETNVFAARIFNPMSVGGLAEPPLELFPADYSYRRRVTPVGSGFVYDEQYPVLRAGFSGGETTGAGRLTPDTDDSVVFQAYASSMTPGIVLAANRDAIRLWGWAGKGYALPVQAVYAGAGGEQTIALGERRADFTGNDLAQPWLLLHSPDAKQRDLLLVFTERPQSIAWDGMRAGGELTIGFSSAPSRLIIARPFFGGPPAESRTPGTGYASLCRWWAERLLAYPVGASQLCRMDEKTWLGSYTVGYRYLDFTGFGDMTQARLAPLPMLCSFGLKHKYPGLAADAAVFPTGFESRYAPYMAAEGDYVSYSAPFIPFSTRRKGSNNWSAWRDRQPREEQINLDLNFLGMDHQRAQLPLDAPWGGLKLMESFFGPAVEDEEEWKKLDWLVETAQKHGNMYVINNCPNYAQDHLREEDNFINRDGSWWLHEHPETRHYLIDFWVKVAGRYAHLPADAVAYDLWNEPAYIAYPDYNPLMKDITEAIRKVDPVHEIWVEGGDGWAQPNWFARLEPTGDTNTRYCFHLYGKYTDHDYDMYYNAGTWPLSPPFFAYSNERFLDEWLDVILFSIRHDEPVMLSETGASIIHPLYCDREWLNGWFGMLARWGISYSCYNHFGAFSRSDLRDSRPGGGLNPLTVLLRKWNAW